MDIKLCHLSEIINHIEETLITFQKNLCVNDVYSLLVKKLMAFEVFTRHPFSVKIGWHSVHKWSGTQGVNMTIIVGPNTV